MLPFELEHGSAPESVQEVSIPSQVVAAGLVTLDVRLPWRHQRSAARSAPSSFCDAQ